MVKKKKGVLVEIWDWLLEKSIWNAALLINLIMVITVAITLAILKLILKR